MIVYTGLVSVEFVAFLATKMNALTCGGGSIFDPFSQPYLDRMAIKH